MRALKIFAVVVVLLFVAYGVHWTYLYQRSKSEATEYCESIAVGTDAAKAAARAEALGIPPFRRSYRPDDKNLYWVIFTGPIFNAFVCELTVADGRIASRRIMEMAD